MSLSILLDRDTFEAGTSVSGSIVVTQQDSIGISAKEIRIGIRGEEQTRVIDKESKQSFDAVCVLHEYSESLPGNILQSRKLRTGSHTIPFQLPLEDGLPQTITIPWTHITYMILCWLEDDEGTKEEQTGVSVNILAKPMVCPYPSPYHMEPFVHLVKKNRLQRGHFVITLSVKDTIMELGGQVGVSLVIRNRSPLLIRRVKIALKQQVHATAVNHEREGERLLTFYEFQEFRKTKRMRSKWLRGVKPEEDFEEVLQELDAEEHQGTLRIPKFTTLSYHGQLFGVSHSLHIIIQTDLEDPIEIPISPVTILRKLPIEGQGTE